MGGEQAANVLATITKDQKAREGKEVKISFSRIPSPGMAWKIALKYSRVLLIRSLSRYTVIFLQLVSVCLYLLDFF